MLRVPYSFSMIISAEYCASVSDIMFDPLVRLPINWCPHHWCASSWAVM